MATGRAFPSDQIRQFTEAGDKGMSVPGGLVLEGSEVVGRRSGFDPSGDKGMSVPGGLVPEASPEKLESPTSFPIVDLAGARLIS